MKTLGFETLGFSDERRSVVDEENGEANLLQPNLLFATVWILTSDRLLALVLSNPEILSIGQSVKGFGFVLVTALLLHRLLWRYLRDVQHSQARLSQPSDDHRLQFDQTPNSWGTVELQAEATVRQSEAWMRQVLENMPVLLDAFDQTGSILVWNEECERVTGYSADEIVGNPRAMESLYPDPVYRQQMVDAWIERGDHHRNWEWELTSKDGTVKTIAWSNVSGLFPVPGWASWGIGVDVSDRKRQEAEYKQVAEAWRRSEERFRSLSQCAPIGIYMADSEGNGTWANPRLGAIAGCDEKALLGLGWAKLIHPDDQAQAIARWQAYHKTVTLQKNRSQPFIHEYRVQRHDGSIRWVRSASAPLFDDGGTLLGRVGAIEDITDQKLAEAAIQRLNATLEEQNRNLEALVHQRTAELRTFINALPDSVFVIENPTMRILFSNATHSHINGFATDALQGKTIFECFPPEQTVGFAEQNRAVFESGEVLHLQQAYPAAIGTLHLDTYKIPLKRPDGSVYALIGTSRNITELVEARQALIIRTAQLEATNRELDSFSYSVSHDLRAPLRHIGGFVKALRDELERSNGALTAPEAGITRVSPTVSRHLQIITDSSKKMGLLIDGLLMLSRMGRRQMQTRPVDLNNLVKTAIELTSHAPSNTPEVTAHPIFLLDPLPTVTGDATLLQQVFTNLIENALKFSRDRHPAQITIGSLPDSTVFVRDNGVGFDMRYADQLFGAFQRLHSEQEFEGTGIGLAIVQRIIHRHNGKIWAESTLGEGATFYFTLNSEALNFEVGN
ncbi:MAG: PAS domain S-box protein [Leptolyngbyaceae cyanobacterium SL_7_1]|nr:PAS domain S-box protein [Leptolyngbyaceae cyanobacterium SL_7_1]